jgi:hypothetical protein
MKSQVHSKESRIRQMLFRRRPPGGNEARFARRYLPTHFRTLGRFREGRFHTHRMMLGKKIKLAVSRPMDNLRWSFPVFSNLPSLSELVRVPKLPDSYDLLGLFGKLQR